MTRDEVIAKWDEMPEWERNIWIATDVMGLEKVECAQDGLEWGILNTTPRIIVKTCLQHGK